MAMSVRLAALHQIREQGPRLDWAQFESRLGTAVPDDYKAFCEYFPPGSFSEMLEVFHPLDRIRNDLLVESAMDCDVLLASTDVNGPYAFPIAPGPGGLIVWGDINGDT